MERSIVPIFITSVLNSAIANGVCIHIHIDIHLNKYTDIRIFLYLACKVQFASRVACIMWQHRVAVGELVITIIIIIIIIIIIQ